MPRHDYKCPECGRVAEFDKPEYAYCYCICIGVPGVDLAMCQKMERLPAAPNFTVKGYSAKNGYSTKT